MLSLANLESNLSLIKRRLEHSAKQSCRLTEEIQIIAVTKGFPGIIWKKTLQLSLSCIGESRIQEISLKSDTFISKNKIELHLIGRLQSNKARKAVELTDVIQTVDSIKLASRLNKIAEEYDKKQRIYLQVNTAMDSEKAGFSPLEIFPAAEKIADYKHVVLEGIMTIPSNRYTQANLQSVYAQTRRIRDQIQQKIKPSCASLSMGMSGDFETAIKEGATHIRLGTAIFGPRPL